MDHDNEYIIGLPSGELINLSTKMVSLLLHDNLCDWDVELVEFVYMDTSYDEIINVISKDNFNIGDNVISYHNMSGEIISVDKSSVIFKTKDGALFGLPFNKVKKI